MKSKGRTVLYVPEGESYRDHPQYDEVRTDPEIDAAVVKHESTEDDDFTAQSGPQLDPEAERAFESAREEGDLQTQVNILYEALFGQREGDS